MTNPIVPTPITELPPAPLVTDTPEQFDDKAFPFAASLDGMRDGVNSAASATYQNAVASNERAAAAQASLGVATTEANRATAQAGIATTKAGEAAASASQASVEKNLAQQAVVDAAAQVGLAAAQAVRAEDEADRAQETVIRAVLSYPDYATAEAAAATLPDGQVVEVTVNDTTLQYVVSTGSLVKIPARAGDGPLNVRQFITSNIDGVTSNQAGIEAAVAAASATGSDLEWPAGTYVSTTNIPYFQSVVHTGRGVIKRGGNVFTIQPKGKASSTNRFYVSTEGADTNDGLTPDASFATVQKGLDAVANFGPALAGVWRVELAAGVYNSVGALSDVRSNNYITISGPNSSYGEPSAVIDAEDTGENSGLSFSENMRVAVYDVFIKNVVTGSTLESGVLLDSGTVGYLKNVWTDNIGANGVKANIRCRLLVEGGSYQGVSNALNVYGNSTAFIGYNGKRVKARGAGAGVTVEGSSYIHTDNIDFEDCAYGIVCDTESHSTNYENTYKNVNVGWERRNGSTINSRGYTFITEPTIRERTLLGLGGVDVESPTPQSGTKNIQFYPTLGTAGRWAFGYPNNVTPNCNYQFSVNGGGSGLNLSTAASVGFSIDSSATNYIGMFAPRSAFTGIMFGDETGANKFLIRHQAESLYMNVGGVFTHRFTSALFGPGVDNSINLAHSSIRIKDSYFANSPTITSDEREKTNWRDQSEAEKSAALEIKSAIKAFKFTESVDAKGEYARWHFGVGAQSVGEILCRHGLNPEQYAFWCYDEWDEQSEIKDEEGNTTQEYRPAGSRYGIRYDELAMFIILAAL